MKTIEDYKVALDVCNQYSKGFSDIEKELIPWACSVPQINEVAQDLFDNPKFKEMEKANVKIISYLTSQKILSLVLSNPVLLKKFQNSIENHSSIETKTMLDYWITHSCSWGYLTSTK